MKFGRDARQSTNVVDQQRDTPQPSRLRELMDWMSGASDVKDFEDYAETAKESSSLGRLASGNIKGRRRVREEDSHLHTMQENTYKSDSDLGNLSRSSQRYQEGMGQRYEERKRTNQQYRKDKDARYKPYGPGGEHEGM